MKKLLNIIILIFAITFNSGCFEEEDNNTQNLDSLQESSTKIVAIDGYIKDATLTDASGQRATYTGSNGEYEFSSSVAYPITLDGGHLEGSNLEFDLSMKANSGEVISPITTLLADHPDLAQKLIDSIDGVNDLEGLLSNYIDSNNSDLAKISQVIYIMIKDNHLKNSFISSLSSSEPKSIEEVFNIATSIVDSSSSNEKVELNSFLTTINSYSGSVLDMESAISDEKEVLVKEDKTPPIITTSSTFSVDENTTDIISTANSIDTHSVTYSLSGVDGYRFKIDLNTGAISFNTPPDYENHQDKGADGTYNITIIATDSVGNSSSKDIAITVLNIADTVPILADTTLSIEENIANGATVGNLTISDIGDSDISSITLSGTGYENFNISNNGAITVSSGANIDYETTASYTLSVIATNSAGDSDRVNLTIDIVDIADVVPTLSDTTLSIEENIADSATVGNLTISDGEIVRLIVSL